MSPPPRIIFPTMGFFRITAIILLAVAPVTAQTRIAGVEISRAYKAFHRTAAASSEFAARRNAINEDPRVDKLKALAAEARTAATEADKLIRGDDEETWIEAHQFAVMKREELQASAKALEDERKKALHQLNVDLVASTRELLDTVTAIATEIAGERGFDLVIDTSGSTNTGMPLVLYAKDLTDLTDEVIARLNADAPAAEDGEDSAAEDEAEDDAEENPDIAPPPTGNEFD